MKTPVVELLITFPAGMALGFSYFAGLWFTVLRLPITRYPVLLSLGSFALRLTLSLGGLYLVMANQGDRLVLGLLGFFVARLTLMRFITSSPTTHQR
ncbi:MAG: ATP synthase subunit I [Candidatus Binatia bacterium]